MDWSSNVKVDVDKFDLESELAQKGLMDGITGLANTLRSQIVLNIQSENLIDTGALLNSVYVQTPDGDGRTQAIAAATAAAATIGQHSGKPHDAPIAEETEEAHEGLVAKVAVAMEYGLYLETGTQHSDERPYVAPAVEEVSPKAADIVGEYIKARMGG